MADALAVRDERTCLVKAGGVSYGTVVDVLDIVSGAGAERLGIVR